MRRHRYDVVLDVTRGVLVAAVVVASAVVLAPVAAADGVTVTVDGVDYPVCDVEDCSDQPGQIGVWFDRTGAAWLSTGETSQRVTR